MNALMTGKVSREMMTRRGASAGSATAGRGVSVRDKLGDGTNARRTAADPLVLTATHTPKAAVNTCFSCAPARRTPRWSVHEAPREVVNQIRSPRHLAGAAGRGLPVGRVKLLEGTE